MRIITAPAPQQPVVALVNQVKRGKRLKQTYRAPKGSPPVRSKGKGSQPHSRSPQPKRPQLDPQLEPQRPEQPEGEEEKRPWIRKPFNAIVASYRQVKKQYMCLERTLESINLYLNVEPCFLLEYIQALSKPQDLADLQAWVDCFLKENGELKTKVEEGKALRKEMEELKDRITVVEEEVKTAREERDKAKKVARKIHSFLGFSGDVLNKAHLYDQGLRQPQTGSKAKMMRCMVNYSNKMEKTLKELRVLLQPTGSQAESAATPAPGPSTVPAPTPSPGFVTPPISQPDPLLQQVIPKINTEDIASLRTWAEGGPGNFTTPTTEIGTIISGSLSIPSPVSQEVQRRKEERTKRKAEESINESGSEEGEEEDPISLDSDNEEYQGSKTPSQSDPVDKPKTPPFKINRPTTQSTPEEAQACPKRKAARK